MVMRNTRADSGNALNLIRSASNAKGFVPSRGVYANAGGAQATPRTVGPLSIRVVKNAVGGETISGIFEFGLYDADDNLIATAANDDTGIVSFDNVNVGDEEGEYSFTIRELYSTGDWSSDDHDINVTVVAALNENDELDYVTTYLPDTRFVNVNESPTCGLIEFPELSFDEPGVYEYKIRESTPSGDGWITDDTEYPVIIRVDYDSNGVLFATAEYPNGFPSFVDVYSGSKTTYSITACKMAVGANLPDGQFSFGVFDKEGDLIATATNNAAFEAVVAQRNEIIAAAKKRLRGDGIEIGENVTMARSVPKRERNTARGNGEVCRDQYDVVMRRLNTLSGLR